MLGKKAYNFYYGGWDPQEAGTLAGAGDFEKHFFISPKDQMTLAGGMMAFA